MPFNISQSLIRKLPEAERADPNTIGQRLMDRDGGRCHLCDGDINLASDTLEADHDTPETMGGKTEMSNLRLAHQDCNRSKRDMSTVQIRPFLKFRRFFKEKGGRIQYDKAITHFNIEPKQTWVKVNSTNKLITCDFADGSKSQAEIFEDQVGQKSVRYAYIEVPRQAIFNDADVQPRNLRLQQIFAIYTDLLMNPLHEPPSCRLISNSPDGSYPFLMFDGQHKTIASWMLGREKVIVKLYIGLDTNWANILVNSIQAKIKKLPLSPFELAAKMSDEWRSKSEQYVQEMHQSGQTPTEAGFLRWVPARERSRAKEAFRSALCQQIYSRVDFSLTKIVSDKAISNETEALTETMIQTKVLNIMISSTPLEVGFQDSTDRRQEESDNIVAMVNQVVSSLISCEGDTPTETELERRRRFFKQGSLQVVSDLLVQIYNHVMVRGVDGILDGVPNASQKETIEKAIANICSHPVWTAAFSRDERMVAVKQALEKNQNVKEAFIGVAMNLSYVIFGKSDDAYKRYWA